MSMITQALKPHRLRRFGDVLRREGPRVAIARARAHLRLLSTGQGQGALVPSGNLAVKSRYAMGSVWSDLARKDAFHVTGAPAIVTGHRSVALIGDLNLPQCRKYRVEQMDELWSGLGVDYAFAHYEDVPRCREILQHATHLVLYRLRRCDLVSMYLYEARRLGIPVLYDIDDPLFSVSAYATYANMADLNTTLRQHFLDEAPLYLDVMNAADAQSFSTPGLADHAGRFSGRPAFVRRNFADRQTLDMGRAALAAAGNRGGGFTAALASGSRGHDADVDVAREGISEFLAARPDRRLLIVGTLDLARFPKSVQGQIDQRPFCDYPAYLKSLALADCVLLPLADDPFNRCKSAVRAIDAAAVGVPVIASPV
ncbi:MAG: hypothetical protein AAGB18_09430, partial [Pseudomonadota bacterium]